jgi:hypothetical protein
MVRPRLFRCEPNAAIDHHLSEKQRAESMRIAAIQAVLSPKAVSAIKDGLRIYLSKLQPPIRDLAMQFFGLDDDHRDARAEPTLVDDEAPDEGN